jgi:hypothetical protein
MTTMTITVGVRVARGRRCRHEKCSLGSPQDTLYTAMIEASRPTEERKKAISRSSTKKAPFGDERRPRHRCREPRCRRVSGKPPVR